jgi:hypothetical protein
MTHRCLLVQFMQRGEPKTLLFNPSDVEGARATSFFARLARDVGERASSWMAKRYDSIETQLATFGLSAGDIDYVAFDHFHTQDLRGLLGTRDGKRKARFPNAVLLAPEVEWRDWDDWCYWAHRSNRCDWLKWRNWAYWSDWVDWRNRGYWGHWHYARSNWAYRAHWTIWSHRAYGNYWHYRSKRANRFWNFLTLWQKNRPIFQWVAAKSYRYLKVPA